MNPFDKNLQEHDENKKYGKEKEVVGEAATEEEEEEFLVVNERPIAASVLGAYHHNSCQLYLHLITKYQTKWPKTAQKSSEKTRASAFRHAVTGKGNVWEDSIRETLRSKHLLFEVKNEKEISTSPSSSSSSSFASSLDEILNHIIEIASSSSSSSSSSSDGSHFYVMDSQFRSPLFLDQFRKKKHLNQGRRVQFSIFKPDFIEFKLTTTTTSSSSSSPPPIEIEARYKIIDAKASSHTKVSHQVQIGFYWFALKEVFGSEVLVSRNGQEFRIKFVSEDVGYVWLHHQDVPTPFSLLLLQPLLEDFLFAKLPVLLACSEEEVYWHYNPVCSSCEFKQHCRTNTIVNKTLSSIPHLSMGDHKLLKSVVKQFSTPFSSSSSSSASSSSSCGITEIEQLHELMEPSSRQMMAKNFPATTEKVRRTLCIPDIKFGDSPLLTSVLEQTPKVISRPCLTLPASEDIGVYLTLLTDPGTEELLGYSIRQHRRSDNQVTTKTNAIEKKDVNIREKSKLLSDSFVKDLSDTIETLRELNDTVQFFIFGQLEHSSLMNILVAKACLDENGEQIQQCIAALADQTDVLMTAVQPELLDYVLQAPGSKDTKQTLKDFLIGCGANPEEVDKKLVTQLRDWIKKMVGEGKRGRKPPRVSVLHTAIRQLISIPEPGFYGLREVVAHVFKEEGGEAVKLLSDEELYNFWSEGESVNAVSRQLELQNEYQDRLTVWIRNLLGATATRVLPADAVRLNPLLIRACKNEHLRRLLFMKQYEAVVKLEQLRFERFSRTGRAIYLEFHQKINNPTKVEIEGEDPKPSWKEDVLIECVVTQGKEYIEVEGTSPDGITTPLLFKWLFVPDEEGEEGFTADMAFNDLLYYDAYPLKIRLEKENLALANIVGVSYAGTKSPEDKRTYVLLQLQGPMKRRKFVQGSHFFLRERFVDFNIKKAISNLIQLDKECASGAGSLFINLLENPIAEVQKGVLTGSEKKSYEKREDELRKFYVEFYDLHATWPSKKLSFHRSQRKAFQSILLNSFSIVWGPPGSGKTHTLALSVLRYLEVVSSLSKGQQKCHVLMTAFTHIAIQQFLKKFEDLLQEMRTIPNTFASGFLESLSVLRLTGDNDQKAPVPEAKYAVVAGTVWSIFKWQTKHVKKKPEFDLLVIDEGSQLPVADAAIAFRCLSIEPRARVVVGGDHFQLPPVFSARYPVFEPMLFGSVLQCLIRTADNHNISLSGTVTSLGPTTTILKENARMVDSLAEFTQQIYGKKFRVLQSRREVGSSEQRKGLENIECTRVQRALRSVFENSTRNHLVTIKLGIKRGPSDLAPVEKHLSCEANVIARVLLGLRKCFQKDKILVATPHRAQRSLINSKIIEISGQRMSELKVDTVERLQGDEAPIVLGAYGFTNTLQLEGELDFIFNRNRLNVAISRAQYLCILVVSENVLNPSMVVLASPERRDAFAHIKSFVKSSFVIDWPLEVDPNTLDIQDYTKESPSQPEAELIDELSNLALK